MRPIRIHALATALLLQASVVPGFGADGWNRGVAGHLDLLAKGEPFTRVLLQPGEQLTYRVRSSLRPPKVPFIADRGTVKLETRVRFSALGLDEERYRLHARVEVETEDAKLKRKVRPLSTGWFHMSHRGRRIPHRPLESEPGYANASQYLRDLSGREPGSETWSERKWMYFYPSSLGLTRIETITDLRAVGVDPETGNLRAELTIRESGRDRRGGRGFRAEGTCEFDRTGVMVRMTAEGRIWKKVLFFRVNVPTRYEVELVSREQGRPERAAPLSE